MRRTPLVLLPGTLLDAELFGHQIVHLSDAAAITVGDLASDDSIAGMARTVLAAAPQRFALAGLSLGGIVAFEIMRQAPERVTRLALLDTNPLPPRSEQFAAWAELGGLAEAGRLDQVVDRLLPGLLRPGWHADARTERAVRAMADRVGAAAYGRQLRALAGRADSRPTLRTIACPTLVLVGRQDALTPVALHEDMAAAIPNAALVVVEQCGHLSPLEQPQAVTAALRYWLQIDER
jgi:pimeloyl-ACP methyl ester carboxylesterase